MSNQEINRRQKKISALQKQISKLGPMMRGTIVRIGIRNKQFYFSLKKDKKTRMIYLGNEREKIARIYVKNYKRLSKIVDEMTLINMEQLKKYYPERPKIGKNLKKNL